MEKFSFETPDMVSQNIEKIAELFPSAITEMRDEKGNLKKGINFETLKQLLSPDVVDGEERYEFTWVGKKAAMAEAARPITKTLRPVKEDSRDWETTENLYIEGDNLEVLKILQESYLGKVKMIYIDPPYNTGKDFVYPDRYMMDDEEYREKTNYFDEEGNVNYSRVNSESEEKFHSDWCNLMYSRLMVARNLLTDDGVIFISIDDIEQDNLNKICEEVFGADNKIASLIWKSKSGGANDSKFFAIDHEYVNVFAKNKNLFVINKDKEAEVTTQYNKKDKKGEYALDRLDKQSIRYSKSLDYEIIGPDGKSYYPKHKDSNHPNASWRWSKEKVKRNYNDLVFENGCVYTKNYKKDGSVNRSILIDERFGRTRSGKTEFYNLFGQDYFSNPKPLKLLRYFEMIGANKDSIVLDFFSGSATTAHAVIQLNAEDGGHRKFIMVQLPEPCSEKTEAYKAGYKNICEIGKERIRRAGDKLKSEHPDADLDIGFRVFRVDESNMKDVYYHPEAVQQQDLFEQVSNIKEDRTDMDLLYACLLDWGVEIHLPHTQEAVEGCTVHDVDSGALMACFDEKVPAAVVEYMAKKQPLRVVFRDSAFASDAEKINVTEIFKNLSPDTKVKVL